MEKDFYKWHKLKEALANFKNIFGAEQKVLLAEEKKNLREEKIAEYCHHCSSNKFFSRGIRKIKRIQYQQEKRKLAKRKMYKHKKFESLKNCLNAVPNQTKHQYFQEGCRI